MKQVILMKLNSAELAQSKCTVEFVKNDMYVRYTQRNKSILKKIGHQFVNVAVVVNQVPVYSHSEIL
jgi:hypothetical protein